MSATTRELLEQLSKAVFDAEIADHIPHALLVSVTEHLEPCSPGCRGWAHFNVGCDREGVQRCDECNWFASDDEAAEAHDKHCHCGASAEDHIQGCHYCLRSLFDGMDISITVEGRAACARCAQEFAERPLDEAGTRMRIGADWGVQTWEMDAAKGLYICDTEQDDGTYELVHRHTESDDEYIYDSVMPSKNIMLLIHVAKHGPKVQFKAGVTKCISNYEIDLSGMTGTIMPTDYHSLEVQLDEHRDDLDEWDNCVIWEDGECPDLAVLFAVKENS